MQRWDFDLDDVASEKSWQPSKSRMVRPSHPDSDPVPGPVVIEIVVIEIVVMEGLFDESVRFRNSGYFHVHGEQQQLQQKQHQ